MLVESNGQHDEDTGEHAQHLQGQTEPVGLLLLVRRDGMGVEREDEADGEVCELLGEEAQEAEDGGGTSDVEGNQDH